VGLVTITITRPTVTVRKKEHILGVMVERAAPITKITEPRHLALLNNGDF